MGFRFGIGIRIRNFFLSFNLFCLIDRAREETRIRIDQD